MGHPAVLVAKVAANRRAFALKPQAKDASKSATTKTIREVVAKDTGSTAPRADQRGLQFAAWDSIIEDVYDLT